MTEPRRLADGEMVVVNATVPNALYHGLVGVYVGCWDAGRRNCLVRFPMPQGMMSLTGLFRRGELDAVADLPADDGG